MSTISLITLNGNRTQLPETSLARLTGSLHGQLLTADSPDFDQARSVWNAMIDRKPALIARCADSDDVIRAVQFAGEHRALVAVRGGGHNIAGSAACDGGLVIDLSQMRGVRIDPRARTAAVEAGATLADFDREAQAFGLATPLGINSTTGVAGLTLGGGFGWISRKHGLTIDNLRGADVVTADGRLRRASADENQDLFWGLRGGGGNLGVVTSFAFDLHEVGPQVLSGLIVHPFEAAASVLRRYRDFATGMPEELNVWFVMRHAPPLPFLPPEVHGKLIVLLAACHVGDVASGEKLLAPLRSFGKPIADVIQPHPYAGWQQAFDPLLTPGARNYWKSHNFKSLSDEALDALIRCTGKLPTPQSEIFVARVGGAINRVPADATAYPHRDTEFIMNVHTRWERAVDDERCTAWARACFGEMAPYATGGVYVNFIPEDEDRVRAAYGGNFERLTRLKAELDPGNLFRQNQNVRPRPGGRG
ncbi:MAG TPA: FAD-binding oxidoreductase [Gemmatimonadota bacterium]|jgi:FAD/FMN-containing dehydrogenase